MDSPGLRLGLSQEALEATLEEPVWEGPEQDPCMELG